MALLAQRTPKSPADWSDRDLLKCVLRSDARGWAELVRRFRPLIYRCITKVTLKYSPTLGGADLDEIYADVMMQLVRDDMHKLHLQPGPRHQARFVDRHDLGERGVRLPPQRRSPS